MAEEIFAMGGPIILEEQSKGKRDPEARRSNRKLDAEEGLHAEDVLIYFLLYQIFPQH